MLLTCCSKCHLPKIITESTALLYCLLFSHLVCLFFIHIALFFFFRWEDAQYQSIFTPFPSPTVTPTAKKKYEEKMKSIEDRALLSLSLSVYFFHLLVSLFMHHSPWINFYSSIRATSRSNEKTCLQILVLITKCCCICVLWQGMQTQHQWLDVWWRYTDGSSWLFTPIFMLVYSYTVLFNCLQSNPHTFQIIFFCTVFISLIDTPVLWIRIKSSLWY